MDIGLAPLRDTEFNKCKSNIKFLEYAIAHVPGVYSPTVYNFRGFDIEFGIVADTSEQWYQAIQNLIPERLGGANDNLRHDIIENAYGHVCGTYDLSNNVRLWEKAYNLATKL